MTILRITKIDTIRTDGGVLLYIHETPSITPIHKLNDFGVEHSVWCLLFLCDLC